MNKASIVIVDDDASIAAYLTQLLSDAGYAVDALTNGDQLLQRLSAGLIPALVLLDVVLPGQDGIHVIEKIMNTGLRIPVIMLSGRNQVRTVVEAMKLGASDFLLKPVDESVLRTAIRNALDGTLSKHEIDGNRSGLVTANPRMARLTQIVKRVAATDVPILLLGESGVGKEVMARYAHDCSGRGGKPFVKVNCAAMPDGLLESELFGYDRGAFTGALNDKPGKFELAHTGTLLLDEIADMSPHLQAKLLHVLQDGSYSRLGGTKPIRVDARVIAATNVNIGEALASGKFREDLYFRLSVISIDLPPLRDRPEDIPLLCRHFIAKYRERYNSEVRELAPELLECFLQYDWPGNIRQLENFIKRFLVLPDHHSLLTEFATPASAAMNVTPAAPSPPLSLIDIGSRAASRAEEALVRRVLEETHGNRKQAAKRMNICYKALLNKLKRWEASAARPDLTSPSNPVLEVPMKRQMS